MDDATLFFVLLQTLSSLFLLRILNNVNKIIVRVTTQAINIDRFCLGLDIVRENNEDFYHVFIPNSDDDDIEIIPGLRIKVREAWFSQGWVSTAKSCNLYFFYRHSL